MFIDLDLRVATPKIVEILLYVNLLSTLIHF
jgi:hypothetical protein